MKKLITFFTICILSFAFQFSFAQNFLWGTNGGGTAQQSEEFGKDIATDRNGNVYIISNVSTSGLKISGQAFTGFGGLDIMLASYRPDGALRWAKLIGGTSTLDKCYWVCTDDKDGVYISGQVDKVNGPINIDQDAVSPKNHQVTILVKYDTAGVYQWYRHPESDTLTAWRESYILAMDVDKAGNVYCLMHLQPGLYGGALVVNTESTFIVKYSASGNFSYIKPDLEASGILDMALTLDEPNNRIYFSGAMGIGSSLTMGGGAITGGMFIGCYKLDGSFIWKRENNGAGNFNHRAVIDASGNIYLAGGAGKATNFNGYNVVGPKGAPLVVKMDKNGNNVWVKEPTVNAASGADAIALRNNNEIIITGHFPGLLEWPGSNIPGFNSPQNYYYDVYITRFDLNGNVLGMDRMASTFGNYESPRCMVADGKGHVYIGGELKGDMFVNQLDTVRSIGGDRDWFLVKYGDMWPSSIEENIGAAAVKIYPNPATEQLVIEGAKAGTTIALCNMMGQQVYQAPTLNGNKHVDISALPAGNYILQLVANNGERINKKMVKQ